jgi:hypothetical protein
VPFLGALPIDPVLLQGARSPPRPAPPRPDRRPAPPRSMREGRVLLREEPRRRRRRAVQGRGRRHACAAARANGGVKSQNCTGSVHLWLRWLAGACHAVMFAASSGWPRRLRPPRPRHRTSSAPRERVRSTNPACGAPHRVLPLVDLGLHRLGDVWRVRVQEQVPVVQDLARAR